MGEALYPITMRWSFADVFRAVRMLERTAHQRTRICHGLEAPGQGQCDGNARRFLSLDINYGRRVDPEMYEFLMDNGMANSECRSFMKNSVKHHRITGNDYYVTNEHRVRADGAAFASGAVRCARIQCDCARQDGLNGALSASQISCRRQANGAAFPCFAIFHSPFKNYQKGRLFY
jgi:hypothetical protein